jgi:autotransporter passenger strand-loop-strand repeat protein/autotransporter-associated beta strand protein
VLTLENAVLSSGGGRAAGLRTAAATVSGVTLQSGAVLDLTSTTVLAGATDEVLTSGVALDTVLSGGTEIVLSGGLAKVTTVSSGGKEVVSAGGAVSGMTLLAGGKLVDDGSVVLTASKTFAGSLSGSGDLTVSGTGDLILNGAGSAFTGHAVISGGTIELATSGAIGTGKVVFGAGTASETLRIDAADAPAAGGTFANTIYHFSGSNAFIDLRSIPFVSGASATVSGSTLVLTDGGKTYKFKLAGTIGGSFPVTSDGHGGTLIDPQVTGFVQAAATFAPTAAGPLSPISSGGAHGFAELLHATASAGGRA